MARAVAEDPLQSHNFALLELPTAGLFPFAFPVKTARDAFSRQAFVGFQAIELPTIQLDTQDVAEGNWPYTHKVTTGRVDSGEVTLSMAVFPTNVDMWLYFQQAVWGRGAPRRSFIVLQMRHSKSPARALLLEDCLPTGWTPSTGHDAASGEVLIESMTLSVHRIRLIPIPAGDAATLLAAPAPLL